MVSVGQKCRYVANNLQQRYSIIIQFKSIILLNLPIIPPEILIKYTYYSQNYSHKTRPFNQNPCKLANKHKENCAAAATAAYTNCLLTLQLFVIGQR